MKIELTVHDQFIITTALKKEATRLTKLVAESNDEYFADKVERQKDLYKRIAGYDMDLPVLLEEL